MSSVARIAALAALVLAGAGCESSGGPAPAARTATPGWVSLERTLGNQSLYIVTLLEDGHVLFEGIVPGQGRRTLAKTIPAKNAAAVFTRLDSVNLWTREPRYDIERISRGGDDAIGRTAPPDVPWDILRAHYRGQSKRIDGFFFAPSELLDLKAFIEQTVGLAGWLAPAAPASP